MAVTDDVRSVGWLATYIVRCTYTNVGDHHFIPSHTKCRQCLDGSTILPLPGERYSAGQDKTRQDKTRQDKTRQDKTRQDKTRQDKTRQDKTRQDKTRQDKTRQDKTRQDKTRQDKTRQDSISFENYDCVFCSADMSTTRADGNKHRE